MYEKSNIKLIISLAILLLATGVAYWANSDGNAVEIIDKDIFRVSDFKAVDKITLASTQAGAVEITFNGTRWRVNNKYDADRGLIDVLFATLQQAEPKRPVAAALKDSLLHRVKTKGVKVSLFEGSAKLKYFYAGGNASKTQAYFNTETDSLYIVVIPGYRVYTSGIFELDENGWRDKRVFNFNWRNFKTLTATFAATPQQDFSVALLDKYFGIKGIANTDTTRLNAYLDAVSLLALDEFIAAGYSKHYDSLMNTPPAIKIEVKDIADRVYALHIYKPQKNNAYVLGKMGNEFVLFNFKKIAPLVRGRMYFVAGQNSTVNQAN